MITFLYSIIVAGEYYDIISNAITRDCNDEVEYLPPCYFVILQLIVRHPSVYISLHVTVESLLQLMMKTYSQH